MFDAIIHPFAVAVAWVWVWIHDFLVLIGMPSGSGIAWVFSIVLLTILVRVAIGMWGSVGLVPQSRFSLKAPSVSMLCRSPWV